MTESILASELIVVGGDLNGHDCINVDGYDGYIPSNGQIPSKYFMI